MKQNYLLGTVILAGIIASMGAGSSAPTTTGGAEVKGGVKVEGIVPGPTRINMTSDVNCIMQHKGVTLTEDIVADKSGDLQNVVVYVSDGLGDRTFDVPAQPVVLEQKGCTYHPHVLALRANQKLEVVNADSSMHNIHPSPANNREWNTLQNPGSTLETTFAREEVAIPLKCNVHPWMHSYLAVFKHPFFAVTGKDGSFDLSNLPPGTYTISAWQEKLGTVSQKVTVGSNETKTVQFVFKAKTGS
ncbi:MAG: carboxypeptidase regulatory-like domain-containing protein [Candidatus Sulfotelmatobacter sp.]|jgi:plastocyanin